MMTTANRVFYTNADASMNTFCWQNEWLCIVARPPNLHIRSTNTHTHAHKVQSPDTRSIWTQNMTVYQFRFEFVFYLVLLFACFRLRQQRLHSFFARIDSRDRISAIKTWTWAAHCAYERCESLKRIKPEEIFIMEIKLNANLCAVARFDRNLVVPFECLWFFSRFSALVHSVSLFMFIRIIYFSLSRTQRERNKGSSNERVRTSKWMKRKVQAEPFEKWHCGWVFNINRERYVSEMIWSTLISSSPSIVSLLARDNAAP